jgi:hypothetical protein
VCGSVAARWCNLIAAIRIHRQVFKSSLLEAKEAVEAIAAKRRR